MLTGPDGAIIAGFGDPGLLSEKLGRPVLDGVAASVRAVLAQMG